MLTGESVGGRNGPCLSFALAGDGQMGDTGGGVENGRGAWIIAEGVPWVIQPQMGVPERQLGTWQFATELNCTVRVGYVTLGSMYNAYRYESVGLYWVGR